ncbi:hypothetical protein F8M41_008404 [Gigaspora margarita]|uniref:Uncharacterized protein n=1 Tax=Gigaspora margarita TaxID=4874 RepID=A0A8H3X3G9_GIGMA|nr:hypothetical protein F8M41_008404 [Gigaspora margarita]
MLENEGVYEEPSYTMSEENCDVMPEESCDVLPEENCNTMPKKSCYTMPEESCNIMLKGYDAKIIEQGITKWFEFATHLREEFNFENFQYVNALLNESKNLQ